MNEGGEGLEGIKINEITGQIVDCAYRVHTTLGPGLLESVYEAALEFELKRRGFRVARQVAIPVVYEGILFEMGFRADMVVEEQVILELKSLEKMSRVHHKQLLTYIRLANKRVGLLINFGSDLIKDGIVRVVNGLEPQ